VRYYATASGPAVREAMRAGRLGMIATPASGNRVEPGVAWIADNSAYTGLMWNQTCQGIQSVEFPEMILTAQAGAWRRK